MLSGCGGPEDHFISKGALVVPSEGLSSAVIVQTNPFPKLRAKVFIMACYGAGQSTISYSAPCESPASISSCAASSARHLRCDLSLRTRCFLLVCSLMLTSNIILKMKEHR